ncbi:MAG: DUF4344 domain-containing metallopeptidase [Pseudomonadota bacterium]
MLRALALLPFIATPLAADEDRYVASNVYAIFYHELGHALIDVLDLPIFGQEEDAADVLSALMIGEYWEEDAAVAIAYDAAFGFLNDAEQTDEADVAYWGVHGPDLQRYYTLICLFYGGNPEEQEDVALELGLPEERIETCEEEYDQAIGSWGAVLDRLAEASETGSDTGRLVLTGKDPEQDEILREEIDWINENFAFPQDIPVLMEPCQEANAFYDPTSQEITMCTEFPAYLRESYREANAG